MSVRNRRRHMIPDDTPTRSLPVKRRGTWLGMVADIYPTAGEVRRAPYRLLLRIPLVGKRSIVELGRILSEEK